ncbi:hypothetical protein [Roseicella aerolata]|uniref:Uncharacterized protein n=1 Tax=Roseicella aerolata TaxID=2883479 RepID=A0A9X1IBE1_9PROT|nr:hypothetical protein [Roseicella aerolata]MCB4820258.1 hypothetical protein [Roseicella aerolata]
MPATSTPHPRPTSRQQTSWEERRHDAALLARSALFHILGGTALLGLIGFLYALKRTLGLDLVPGLDLLPDLEIEDALAMLFGG